MKLREILDELDMSTDYEQQVEVLKQIRKKGFCSYSWTNYTLGVEARAVILPYSDRYAQMIDELTNVHNFLDILEFQYIRGEIHK